MGKNLFVQRPKLLLRPERVAISHSLSLFNGLNENDLELLLTMAFYADRHKRMLPKCTFIPELGK